MSYEKEAISIHVETHFLTLDSYGRMYERKRIQKLEAEKKEEKVKESIDKDAKNENQEAEGMNCEKGAENGKDLKEKEGTESNEKVLSKSDAKEDDLDKLNKSLAKLAQSGVGKQKAEVKIQDLKHQPNDYHRSNGNSSKVGKGIENEEDVEIEKDAEIEKYIERSPESHHNLSIESSTGKDGKDDVFVYLCPFPSCDFSTDFEVISLY